MPLNKILHVEDDLDIQNIANVTLTSIGGFVVNCCSSGAEALKVAKDFMPDLILLDVMMPEMDGPTTLATLREIPEIKNVPAIFMTAKAQTDEINSFLALGAIGVITKPFNPMTLPDEIRTIWQNWIDQDES